MKLLSLFALSLLSLPAFAEKEPTWFVCGGQEGSRISLALQIGGPRYADSIALDLAVPEAKQLLGPAEQELDIKDPTFSGFLTHGACERGSADSDLLVRCVLRSSQGWSMLSLGFTTSRNLNEKIRETSRITRNAGATELEILVRRVGNSAQLELNGTFEGLSGPVSLKSSRAAGPFGKGWNACRFK
ncbi:MAG: hypothetical protein EOP11_09705 [Proteobacteria bacterium]|nr:MAG: hypothetical protein EOP11_09705 [Pseudomonadota bacterium]